MSLLNQVTVAQLRSIFAKTLDVAAFQIYRQTQVTTTLGTSSQYTAVGSPIDGKLHPIDAREVPTTMQIDVLNSFFLLTYYDSNIQISDQVVHIASGTKLYVKGVRVPRTGSPINIVVYLSEDAAVS